MLRHIPLTNIATRRTILLVLLVLNCQWTFAAEQIPQSLKNIGIEEHIASNLDTSLTFTTHEGQTLSLQAIVNNNLPIVLNLAYYSCPMLCHLVASGLVESMNQVNLALGKDYQVVTLSIDPNDTQESAIHFREKYLAKLNKKYEKGWYFLTGTPENINKIAKELGFLYSYNPETKQFAHSAALTILNKNAVISRYLYGIEYRPFDLKMSLIESNHEAERSAVERVLLFCYNYDPLSRKYVLYAMNMMRAGGVITLLLMISGVVILNKKKF